MQQVGQPLQSGADYERARQATETKDASDGEESQRKRQKKGASPKKKRGRKDKVIEDIEGDDLALLEAETARKNSTIAAEEAKDAKADAAQSDKTEHDHQETELFEAENALGESAVPPEDQPHDASDLIDLRTPTPPQN